jgi:hypothetical protein
MAQSKLRRELGALTRAVKDRFQNLSPLISADVVDGSSSGVGSGGTENRRAGVVPTEVPPWAAKSGNATCGRTRIRANREISKIRTANRHRFIERLSLLGISSSNPIAMVNGLVHTLAELCQNPKS